MSHKIYDSDLTDAEWERIKPLLPPEKPLGSHREVALREVLDAIFGSAKEVMMHCNDG